MWWALIYGIVMGLIDNESAAHPCTWDVSFRECHLLQDSRSVVMIILSLNM